ncbi:hypothetical protein MRX96_018673 [Rhipicephalus microplus]
MAVFTVAPCVPSAQVAPPIFRPWAALVVGAVAALLVLAAIPLLDRLRVDDPTETFAAHGVCGLWGLLAIGLFPERDTLMDYTHGRSGLFAAGGDASLLAVQAAAAACIIAWAVGASALLLLLIKYTIGLRMTAEQEILGPDLVDHDIEHDYNSPFLRALQEHYRAGRKLKGTQDQGFGLLESGCVSRKNEVNILMKNVADVVVGGLGYWCFGYGLQFSSGGGSALFNGFGFFLVDAEMQDMGRTFACFLFQLSFATTATTIVSGAMAERTNFTAYCIFSFFDTLVFCIPAGWLWASGGFLRQLGALDFAGAGCVHLLGGTSALVAAAYLGPRVGRYGSGGSAYLGALDSLLVGSLGALLSSGVTPLLNKFRVDDPVDAVSVHGCGGAWGLLAIGLFVHDFSDEDDQDDQDEQCSRCGLFRGGSAYLLAIQALTCVTIVLWSAITTYILLVVVNRLVPIRLSLEQEVLGADLVEHGIVHPDIDYAQLLRRNGLEPSNLLPPPTAERLDREAWDLRLCRSYLAEHLGGTWRSAAGTEILLEFPQEAPSQADTSMSRLPGQLLRFL